MASVLVPGDLSVIVSVSRVIASVNNQFCIVACRAKSEERRPSDHPGALRSGEKHLPPVFGPGELSAFNAR
jgi:hypothetical protein